MSKILSLCEIRDISIRALSASGASDLAAQSVAASIAASEADGIHSHGMARLGNYCEQLRCGKVVGQAQPTLEMVTASMIRVDAKSGFAHPAIDLGFEALIPAAKEKGVAVLAIHHSYNCGVVGYHVERLARAGLVGMGFVNASASIAPWGGNKAVFGTNPVAFAAPLADSEPLVIDQSSSVIARSEIMVHAQKGEPIPEGWALDGAGRPTTDPQAALSGGTMIPAGQYKGAGIALMVEVLAAALTGATLSAHASSFNDNVGGAPNTGQLFIAINPGLSSGGYYAEQIGQLMALILDQDGVRLPGSRRYKFREKAVAEGVAVRQTLLDKLLSYS